MNGGETESIANTGGTRHSRRDIAFITVDGPVNFSRPIDTGAAVITTREVRPGVVANLDECPGAIFGWSGKKEAHVEALDAIDNQALGRDIGAALRK